MARTIAANELPPMPTADSSIVTQMESRRLWNVECCGTWSDDRRPTTMMMSFLSRRGSICHNFSLFGPF